MAAPATDPQTQEARPTPEERKDELAAELAALYNNDVNVTVRGLMARTGHSYGVIYRLLTVRAGITLRPRGGSYRYQRRW